MLSVGLVIEADMEHHNNNPEVRSKITIGERLRNARENVGLSQQEVADKLYLKVSVIRNIEKNYIHPGVSLIFLNGYIRSYAKLLKIPDRDISSMLSENCSSTKHLQTLKQPNLSFKKIDFSDYNWVLWVMWIVCFIVIGLIFVYYWYCYQADKQVIIDNHENLLLDNFEGSELNLMSIIGIFVFFKSLFFRNFIFFKFLFE